MSETVKLIIEIPAEDYEHIKQCYESHDIVEATYSYIYHGKPLSEVLAEIKEEITKGQAYSSITYISDVIEIIDKHISGEENKE